MKIKNRLYLNREINLKLIIDFNSKQSHYLSKVLRCKLTDHISIFNKKAEYLVELLEINSKKAKGIVVKKIKSLRKSSLLTLYFSPMKKTPTEILIQKCSEIGVNIFQPIIMEHTQFSTFNVERLKLIAIEAIEQSGQILIPKINIPIHFNDFIKNLDSNENIYACSLSSESISISKALSVNRNPNTSVLIGPEGDFSEKELLILKNNSQITSVTLGESILKAETAAVVATSFIKESSNND